MVCNFLATTSDFGRVSYETNNSCFHFIKYLMKNITRTQYQAFPFHLVEPSPWPILTSFALLTLTVSAVLYFHGFVNGGELLTLGFILVSGGMVLWFRDVIVEGTYEGHHTSFVQRGLTMGVALFIVSEVFAFVSVFWAFFHSSLAPVIEIGSQWPPVGIEAVNAFELPLLNTILLLSSGATVTYSHHALIQGNRRASIIGLILTIILALAFTACQGIEYYNTSFSMSDSVFGTVFFASTGLHGLHVIVGTLFLLVGLFRLLNYHLSDSHHLGYESAILYWHKK